ncbi:hypothetical protein HOH87_06870 [bacterium]|jgi:hypothetical protein|nr:hypothetical protein [bacterium]
MRKKTVRRFMMGTIIGLSVLMSTVVLAGTKQETIDHLKSLSIDEFNEVIQSWKQTGEASAIDTGYVKGWSWGGGGGFFAFFPNVSGVNADNSSQAGNINVLYGGAGGFMISLDDRWALGGLFGGMGGGSAEKVGDDYHHYDVWGSFQMAAVKYKAVITDRWIMDIDLGVGVLHGGYDKTITNEQFTGSSVSRFKAMTPAIMVGIDMRYRLTPTWYVGSKAGYFGSKIEDLERAGVADEETSLDFTGSYVSIGMGGNF